MKTELYEIKSYLFSHAEEPYRRFQSGLLPTLPPEKILGVRTPILRKYAKSIKNTPQAEEFLLTLPHQYYEENNLHAFLIAELESEALYEALERFLPYVDNWATCDSLRPKYLKKNKEGLRRYTHKWLSSPHLYARRFAIEMRMLHFLDDPQALQEDLDLLSSVKSQEYYEQMMIAWYFAEALAANYDVVLPYFTEKRLKEPVLQMAKRKAFDSFKLTKEQKALLKKQTHL